jgi:multidrug efflux pump
MTSLAFIMGVVPMVVASGPGSEMRNAIGVAVFFGMLGVTLFGLMLTPVFYVLLRKMAGGVRLVDKHGHHAFADTPPTTTTSHA